MSGASHPALPIWLRAINPLPDHLCQNTVGHRADLNPAFRANGLLWGARSFHCHLRSSETTIGRNGEQRHVEFMQTTSGAQNAEPQRC